MGRRHVGHRGVERGVGRVVVLLTFALTSLVACSGDGGDGGTPTSSTIVVRGEEVALVPATVPEFQPAELDDGRRAAIDAAIASGGAYVEQHLADADPASLAYFDYLWRNWEVPGLGDARSIAQDAPRPTDGEQALMLRLVHPDDPLPALEPGADVNPMALALHCDQTPLPDDFVDRLADQVRAGGPYDLSHAAYSIVWLADLGCRTPDLTPVVTGAVGALEAELTQVVASGAPVDHDTLLLGVGLVVLGRADLIPVEWYDAVVAAQRDDGGWAQFPDDEESTWHTTGVALWTLAAATGPGAGAPFVFLG